jgi:hypothetical protein
VADSFGQGSLSILKSLSVQVLTVRVNICLMEGCTVQWTCRYAFTSSGSGVNTSAMRLRLFGVLERCSLPRLAGFCGPRCGADVASTPWCTVSCRASWHFGYPQH